MPDLHVLMIEKHIDNAFNSLTRAALFGESLRDQSLTNDLYQIRDELSRLQLDLLNDRRRPR